jgi:hypothetical protein
MLGVILVLVCTVGIVFTLPIPPIRKGFLILLVLSYGSRLFWNRALLQGGDSILRLSYDSERWELQDRIKTWNAELCGESTITHFLSILRFTTPNKRKKRTCLIFKDALGQDRYRQLVVILRNATIH